MKRFIPIATIALLFCFHIGCKDIIEDSIDCISESLLLHLEANADSSDSHIVHFEFVNNDTEGSFTLDQEIKWDFGDGNTGTGMKVDHIYSNSGDFQVKASYSLLRGSASCNSSKEKTINIP